MVKCDECGKEISYDDAKGCAGCPAVLCSDECKKNHQQSHHLPQNHGQD